MGKMHLQVCIGFNEQREGPMLGLRDFVGREVLSRWPDTGVGFSSYKDDLAGEIQMHAARAKQPLVLLGHSYGAAALVRAASMLPQLRIDHLIMLDPVPNWNWRQYQWKGFWLTPNISSATNIYRPGFFLWTAPICGGCERFQNIRVKPRHSEIPGDPDVQKRIIEIIGSVAGAESADG